MELTPEQLAIGTILMPYAMGKQQHVRSSKQRFVHYTSADVAMSILTKGLVWMRNAVSMNDFSEMQHGKACLIQAYSGEPGARFKVALDHLHEGFSADLAGRFNSWMPHFERGTYMTCLSEHDDMEDDLGRLSMWRAYGKRNGIGLVMNCDPFVSQSDVLKAYTSPVSYLTPNEFSEEFMAICENLEKSTDLLKLMSYEALMGTIFNMFRFAMLCTKHPGFHEEREWRIVYNPTFDSSEHIVKSMEVVNGVPQMVYKIPMKSIPDEGLVGADPKELLDRVIIGPTQDSLVLYEAFVTALADLGIEDPISKVVVSGIPLRT